MPVEKYRIGNTMAAATNFPSAKEKKSVSLDLSSNLQAAANVCYLLQLPLEIRDQIYTFVLSPTGYVCLKESKASTTNRTSLKRCFEILPALPSQTRYRKPETKNDGTTNLNLDMNNTETRHARIDLSLLRVCKQISEECGDAFWQNNTCYLSTSWANHRNLYLCWPEVTRSRIQHTILRFDIYDYNKVYRFECPEFDTIPMLKDWARNNSLKSVELCIIDDSLLPILNLLNSNHDFYLRYLGWLKQGREQLSRVQRKISAYDEARFSPSRKHLRSLFARCELHPLDIFLKINEAFGGELWVNGELCYKDGKMIKTPFDLDRDASEDTEEEAVELLENGIPDD